MIKEREIRLGIINYNEEDLKAKNLCLLERKLTHGLL